jgi:hypothetical protein
MAINIKNFLGVLPALTPWKLPLGAAQIAQNINPDSRTIKPWQDAVQVLGGFTAGATTTIFRFGRSLVSDTQYWFQWAFDVDVVKGPIVADSSERTFWTGDGAPKWTNATLALTGGPPYPHAYRDLGVTPPVAAPVMSVLGTAASGDYQVVGYAYTNVTAYGEESAPSAICAGQKVYSGQTASLTGFDTLPAGATNSCVARRLYRSVTSSTDTNLYFVKESNAATIVDDVGSNIGEAIQTTSWLPPPSTLFGLTAMANGILIGFDGYDVCPSAQYAPYAWPLKWKLSCDFPIVGGKAIGNQVVVLTRGNPYMLSGKTPDSLSLTKIESPEACVSKRSIVNISAPMSSMMGPNMMVGTVYYASQNGLIAIDSGGSVRNVLNGIMNRSDWQALVPTSIQGYAYNGKYFGFFNTGSVQGGFCFDPRGTDGTCLTLFPFYATGGFMDLVQDHLLLQVGTNIVLWNSSATPLTATWRSGVIETPMQTWHSVCVLARSYAGGAVVCNLYGDGLLVWSETVTGNRPFRVPMDDKCFQWEVEIVTTSEVYEITLATSAADMRASAGG